MFLKLEIISGFLKWSQEDYKWAQDFSSVQLMLQSIPNNILSHFDSVEIISGDYAITINLKVGDNDFISMLVSLSEPESISVYWGFDFRRKVCSAEELQNALAYALIEDL